jgi:hypothetical protein
VSEPPVHWVDQWLGGLIRPVLGALIQAVQFSRQLVRDVTKGD